MISAARKSAGRDLEREEEEEEEEVDLREAIADLVNLAEEFLTVAIARWWRRN